MLLTRIVNMKSTSEVATRSEGMALSGSTGVLPATVAGVLAEARENLRMKNLAFARDLELAAHLADLSGAVPGQRAGLPGAERLVQLGHDGTPLVAEFTSLEYAAVLRTTVEAAEIEMGIALDLRHRHPRLWSLVMAGELNAHRAKDVTQITAELPIRACLAVDAQLATLARSLPWHRLKACARALVLENLPEEIADAKQRAAMDRRKVEFGDSELGVTDLVATVTAADGIHLNATINWVSSILAQGGNENTTNVRRAQALGILATPARALQLMQASLLDQLPHDLDTECPRQGSAGHTCGALSVDPDKLLPKAELVVHLTDSTLAEGTGVVRLENLGEMMADWATELVGHSRVSVRPVIDANHLTPVDSYEIPGVMRRAVQLRNPFDVFPWSKRSAKNCDLDHTDPYQWSLAQATGQTRIDNLAPLGRRAHRAKTHGGWRMSQPVPGVFLWRSPHGHNYLVTPSGTHELHVPEQPLAPRKTDWGLSPSQLAVRRRRGRRAAEAAVPLDGPGRRRRRADEHRRRPEELQAPLPIPG